MSDEGGMLSSQEHAKGGGGDKIGGSALENAGLKLVDGGPIDAMAGLSKINLGLGNPLPAVAGGPISSVVTFPGGSILGSLVDIINKGDIAGMQQDTMPTSAPHIEHDFTPPQVSSGMGGRSLSDD